MKTDDTLDMDERETTNKCSSLYIGYIEISLEGTVASTSSLEHEDENLVALEFFLGSTLQSPLGLHYEVDLRDEEEGESNDEAKIKDSYKPLEGLE